MTSLRNALITGANSGIGLVTAIELARQEYGLTIVCRTEEKGHIAATHIHGQTGHRPRVLACEFSKPKEIDQVAEQVLQTDQNLHVLVNNAGAYFPLLQHDARGLEMSLAVNHMGYFQLTSRLLPCLTHDASARIVSVASRAHTRGAIHFDDLNYAHRRYTGMGAYASSKLMNVLFTTELARRLQGTNITANCLHPGVVGTGFAQDEPGLLNSLMKIGKRFLLSPEDGAKTTLHVALAPEVENITGAYFSDCKQKRPSKRARSAEDAASLWACSEQWMP